MEKPYFASAKTKMQISCTVTAQLINDFVFPTVVSTIISLLSISEVSSLLLSSVAVQPGLHRTWSQIPKTGFLATRLRYS